MRRINVHLDQRHEVVVDNCDYDDYDDPSNDGGGGDRGGGNGGGRQRCTGIHCAFHMCGLAPDAIESLMLFGFDSAKALST
jgi:hypothetical protein